MNVLSDSGSSCIKGHLIGFCCLLIICVKIVTCNVVGILCRYDIDSKSATLSHHVSCILFFLFVIHYVTLLLQFTLDILSA